MKKVLLFAVSAMTICAFAGEREFVRQELVVGGAPQQFRVNANRPDQFNRKPVEASSVQATCDGNNLYFTITMDDNDIVCEAEKDQTPLRNLGDSIQILIKSEKDTYIWEFQVDCEAHRSTYFHFGPGRIFYPQDDNAEPYIGFGVENTITEGKWVTKICIPLSIFRAKGFKFTNDENWTFSIQRHNFSRFNDFKETSSYPQVVGNMYNPQHFGRLVLE